MVVAERKAPQRAKYSAMLFLPSRGQMALRRWQTCRTKSNLGSSPGRILKPHSSNELNGFQIELWSAYLPSRFPSPEQAKTFPLPTDNRLWLKQG